MWRPFTSRRTHQRQRTLAPHALTRNQCHPKFESLEERTVPAILFSSTGSRSIVDTGGPILQSMQVDLIFWGSHWNDPGQNQTLRTNVQNTVTAILNSTYFDGLSQYRLIGHGSLLRSDTITSSSPGATFQTAANGDLATMVANNINNGTLPSPNGRILYFVVPQPGSTASDCGCIGRHLAAFASGNRVFPYGLVNNPTGAAIDSLSWIISHELAEAATNPEWNITIGGTSQAAFHVPGSNGDEIGDGEPNNNGYFYRVNGALVQAFLSQRDHAYIVTNGSTNNFLVSSARVLTLTSPFVGNQFFIGLVGNNGVAAELNSSTAQFEQGAISSVQVTAPSGTLTIAGTPVPVNVQYNGANARVDLGNSTNGVQNVRGAVNIQNSNGRTTVVVDDSGNRNGTTARQILPGMGFDIIRGLAQADIAYRGVQTGAVYIYLGSGANTFTVENTNTAGLVSDPTTLTTGRGNGGNTVNVLATDVTTPLNLVGGGPNTTVNLGNPSHGVQDIHGLVNLQIFAGGVRTTLNVDDSGNRNPVTARQYLPGMGFDIIHSLAPADIDYRGVQTGAVTITLGSGANTFTVGNTNTAGDGSATTLNTGTGNAANIVYVLGTDQTTPLTVVSRGSNTTVNVGNDGNRLDDIRGPLTVTGQAGSTALTVNDQGTTTDKTYEIYANAVKRVLNQDSRTYDAIINYANIGTLTVNGGSGSNIFVVLGTAAGTSTSLNGGAGLNQFAVNVGSNALLGPVALHGRPGSNSFLTYDDQSDAAAQTYTLTANTLSRTGAAPVTFDNLNEVVLAGALVGGNTINVPSVAAGVTAAFNPDNGDTITIGANQTLADVQGQVYVNAGDNLSVNVVIDDSSNPTPPSGPINLSNDVTFGFTISGLAPAAIYLSARQNTTLNTSLLTGSGDKIFNMQAAPVGVALTLNAGGGTNTLNYTGLTGNVLANFQTREFTGFSSTSNIQNVIGGQGANILVGDGNESFTGGTGRNIIVSGGGSGQITGGGAGDILIGGTTAYDTDDASLQAILSYWTTSGDDYATRVANLRAGNGVPQLEGGVSVLDNGAANTITGNGSEDQGIFNLFYVTEAGTVTDPQPDEVVVDIDNPAGAPRLADRGDWGNLAPENLPAAAATDLFFLRHQDELSGVNGFAVPAHNGRTLAADRLHPAIRAADLTNSALDSFAPW